MDRRTLQEIIIREARRDLFQGVGRIRIDEFLHNYGVTREEFIATLKTLPNDHRITINNMALIYGLKQEKT